MALISMYRFTRRRRTTVSTLWSSGTSVAVQGLRRAATSSSLKLMVRHPLRPATSFSCHCCSALRLNCLFYCVLQESFWSMTWTTSSRMTICGSGSQRPWPHPRRQRKMRILTPRSETLQSRWERQTRLEVRRSRAPLLFLTPSDSSQRAQAITKTLTLRVWMRSLEFLPCCLSERSLTSCPQKSRPGLLFTTSHKNLAVPQFDW